MNPTLEAFHLTSMCTAAGGRFRGALGRAIFRTTCVCQSIIKPDIVINKVIWWVKVKAYGSLLGYNLSMLRSCVRAHCNLTAS